MPAETLDLKHVLKTRTKAQKGFTLIEFAIFLLIAGTVLGVAAAAWSVLVQGREIQAARNKLNEANNCLMDYVLLARKIPTANYFSASCLKTDPWGMDIRFVSMAAGRDVNCTSPTAGTFSARLTTTDTRTNIAWMLISPGPNRIFEYTIGASALDISSGDDVYVLVSDMEIHKEACR